MRRSILPLAIVLSAIAPGCRSRRTYTRPEPVDGVKLYASAELAGPARDTLVVRVSGRNTSRHTRYIHLSHGPDICGPGSVLTLVYDARRGRRPAWDSNERWRIEREARVARNRAAAAAAIAAGQRPIEEACVASLPMRFLDPGDSGGVAMERLPVRAILGDSLAPGRYRIAARMNGNAMVAGVLRAGEVELGAPRSVPP